MSYHLALRRPDVFSAAAPQAALPSKRDWAQRENQVPLALMSYFGMDDTVMHPDGTVAPDLEEYGAGPTGSLDDLISFWN